MSDWRDKLLRAVAFLLLTLANPAAWIWSLWHVRRPPPWTIEALQAEDLQDAEDAP